MSLRTEDEWIPWDPPLALLLARARVERLGLVLGHEFAKYSTKVTSLTRPKPWSSSPPLTIKWSCGTFFLGHLRMKHGGAGGKLATTTLSNEDHSRYLWSSLFCICCPPNHHSSLRRAEKKRKRFFGEGKKSLFFHTEPKRNSIVKRRKRKHQLQVRVASLDRFHPMMLSLALARELRWALASLAWKWLQTCERINYIQFTFICNLNRLLFSSCFSAAKEGQSLFRDQGLGIVGGFNPPLHVCIPTWHKKRDKCLESRLIFSSKSKETFVSSQQEACPPKKEERRNWFLSFFFFPLHALIMKWTRSRWKGRSHAQLPARGQAIAAVISTAESLQKIRSGFTSIALKWKSGHFLTEHCKHSNKLTLGKMGRLEGKTALITAAAQGWSGWWWHFYIQHWPGFCSFQESVEPLWKSLQPKDVELLPRISTWSNSRTWKVYKVGEK